VVALLEHRDDLLLALTGEKRCRRKESINEAEKENNNNDCDRSGDYYGYFGNKIVV